MSTTKLNITELDFDTIKSNLKTYLKSQKEFQDYDFDGSGLSVLLDVLAYNTHYNAYYLNMVANESFLDTAILRDSVVSHAKTLGYIPYSRKAARAVINIDANASLYYLDTLTLPRGFSFRSEVYDNTTYNFCLLDDITITKANNNFYFENVEIYEGNINSIQFTYDEVNNPNAVFILPDKNIDTDTIRVRVQNNNEFEIFTLAKNITLLDSISSVYFLEEGSNEKYSIYFGNNVLGKKLQNGAIINVSYLITSGVSGNKLQNFVALDQIGSLNNFVITTISEASGGAEKETINNIKLAAPSQYSSQNRLVTINDYETYLKTNYPSIESLSVWGGEDNNPKVYGKVFISIKPLNDYYLSETEKERIINEIIKPVSIINILPVILDPEYLFVNIIANVRYNPTKTLLSQEELKTIIRNKIIQYDSENLQQFKSSILISRLQEMIDSSDYSIIGNDVTLKVQKRFEPILNTLYNYTLNFNIPLKTGTITNKLLSTEFDVYDSSNVIRTVLLEEVLNSQTGLASISIIDPGTNYTSTPIVTITGDGTGATAEAVIVNGRVSKINITNTGINYTKATVTITGGGGYGATAMAFVNYRMGELRTVYFNELSEKIVVNDKIGTINYDNGIMKINNLNILRIADGTSEIKVTIEPDSGMLESTRNVILTIDQSSIQINLKSV